MMGICIAFYMDAMSEHFDVMTTLTMGLMTMLMCDAMDIGNLVMWGYVSASEL